MIKYILKQNLNERLTSAYKKWYAYSVVDSTIDLKGLSEHMAKHNTPFSAGVISGVLTDMVNCIKELLLDGKNVKIDNLAIFSVGIKNAGGATSKADFNVTENIRGVKFRARATGSLSTTKLNLEATLRKAIVVNATSGSQETEPEQKD